MPLRAHPTSAPECSPALVAPPVIAASAANTRVYSSSIRVM
jgi:hypothetical protein